MGQRFNRLGVSKKQKKQKKSVKSLNSETVLSKKAADQVVITQKTIAQKSEKPVTSSVQSNFDFFGFSPTAFFSDFKRTLISSVIILLILLIIFFVIK